MFEKVIKNINNKRLGIILFLYNYKKMNPKLFLNHLKTSCATEYKLYRDI